MTRTLGRLLVVLATLALLPPAAAHSAGEGPVEATGSVALEAGGSYLLELTSLGGVEGGDVLRLQWSVNEGAGPPVHFALWAGEGASRDRVHEVEAIADEGEVTLPDATAYQAVWTNDGGETVTLDYRLEIVAPQGSPFDLIPLVLLAAAGVLFVYLLWRGRRRKEEPAEAGSEGEGAPHRRGMP